MHCSGTLHCRRIGCRGRTEQDGLSFIEHWGGSGAPGCPLSLLSLWVIPQQFSHCWMQLKVDGRTCGSLARSYLGEFLLSTPFGHVVETGYFADWDSRLAEHIFPGDILSRPEVRAVPDLLPSTTSGCADWMAGCIDRSLSDGDLRNTLVAPSAPPSSSSSLAHDAVQEAEKKRRRLMVWPRER